jgi:hypothetical protein
VLGNAVPLHRHQRDMAPLTDSVNETGWFWGAVGEALETPVESQFSMTRNEEI